MTTEYVKERDWTGLIRILTRRYAVLGVYKLMFPVLFSQSYFKLGNVLKDASCVVSMHTAV